MNGGRVKNNKEFLDNKEFSQRILYEHPREKDLFLET